uniref:Ovule protein n=1 Tax=Mesocestoides corti TaxID=53468 RepID=A0A5K3EXF9_MESCO
MERSRSKKKSTEYCINAKEGESGSCKQDTTKRFNGLGGDFYRQDHVQGVLVHLKAKQWQSAGCCRKCKSGTKILNYQH